MSGGKTKSNSRTTTTQTLNPWSQDMWTQQNDRVRTAIDAAPGVQAYAGRSNADFGASADQYMNPYEQQVIDTTMADITRMNEGQNAASRGRAAASGAYGGSGVAVAESLNNAEAQRQMASTGAQLRYQGYNDARGLYGQDINNEYNDWLRQQEDYQRRIQTEMGLLGTVPILTNSSGTSQNTQSTNPGTMGILGQGLGLASMFVPGGSLASMFVRGAGAAAGHAASSNATPSDIRVKEDIEPMGQRGGHNWYRFRYVWDEPGTVHEGVMAQEVMQTRPDAVIERDGILMVDYSVLGV